MSFKPRELELMFWAFIKEPGIDWFERNCDDGNETYLMVGWPEHRNMQLNKMDFAVLMRKDSPYPNAGTTQYCRIVNLELYKQIEQANPGYFKEVITKGYAMESKKDQEQRDRNKTTNTHAEQSIADGIAKLS